MAAKSSNSSAELLPVVDRVTGEGGVIVGWSEKPNGGFYAVSRNHPAGAAAEFCIAHQRLFPFLGKCPECGGSGKPGQI
jgi:hypothetical protein